jgi:fumarate hydratase class II
MPGKVNPVIAEAAIMVMARVIGNDATISTAALGGVGSILDLNVAMPVMAEAMLESVELLANAVTTFTEKLLDGLEPDRARAASLIEGSLAMATSLVPALGYDKAAALAKQALAEGKTVRQLAEEQKLLPKEELDRLLDPRSMTLPGGEGSSGG